MISQTKRSLPKSLSLLLAVVLFLGMVLIPAKTTQAAGAINVPSISNVKTSDKHTVYGGVSDSFSFTVPATGTLELAYIYANGASTYASVKDQYGATIYADDSSYKTENGLTLADKFYTKLNKGQTYYLSIDNSYSPYAMQFIMAYAANSGTLPNGKAVYGGTHDNQVSYYKVTASKNGYLNVQFRDATGKSYPSYQVRLLNAKKQGLTHDFERISSYNSYQTTFGVKKGTYYLAVKAPYNPLYTIKATNTAVKTKAGAKKSKAVTLKKGKTKKGVIYAKNKKTPAKQWYKFKVTKRKKVKLYVNTKTSGGNTIAGGIKVTMSAKRSYGTGSQTFYYGSPSGVLKPYTVGNKGKTLDPGVYYVCVSGYNYGNGYYTLKWK